MWCEDDPLEYLVTNVLAVNLDVFCTFPGRAGSRQTRKPFDYHNSWCEW